MTQETKFWALKSVPEGDLSYKSNDGYKDDLRTEYVYDDAVANHKQISAGDIAVITDKAKVLGVLRISRIETGTGKKERRRCPECGSTNYEIRKTKTPIYRCNKGHEFDVLDSETVQVKTYRAIYNDSFIQPDKTITVDKLRPYFQNNYNRNMSMQSLSKTFFVHYFKGELEKLNEAFYYPSAEEGYDEVAESASSYSPNDVDERERVIRAIKQRRGQQKFREALVNNYGQCMVTACDILDILEAAHINPYKGLKDHHVTNGLLLRADIHTLFDLDLIGIDSGGRIHISRLIQNSEYENLKGRHLELPSKGYKPNEEALKLRWERFLSKKDD